MPEIEHRRHSLRDPDGASLTQSGVELARGVGQTMGRFDLVVTSDQARAYETAIAMGYAVQRQAKRLSRFGKGVEDEIEWEKGAAEVQRGNALGLKTAKACRKQADLLRSIAAELAPDGRALLISHGGVIEQGLVGLLPDFDYSAWGPACDRCEGVRLYFEGDVCVSAVLLRLAPLGSQENAGAAAFEGDWASPISE